MTGLARPHIMFATVSAYPLGGIAVWLDYMARGLRDKGYRVSVILTSGKWHEVEKYVRSYPNLPNIITVRNKTGSREGRVSAICRAIIKTSPDTVISANLPDCIEAVNRAKKRNNIHIKNVVAVHGIQPDVLADMGVYASMLDGIICTNRLAVKLVERLVNVGINKIHYAQCGTKGYSRRTEPVEYDGGKKQIAWVGRFEEFHKRVLDSISVVEKLPLKDYDLLIVGGGPCRKTLEAEIKKRNMTESVTLIDTLDKDRLYEAIYSRVSALLITSYSETGPLVMWEAMSMSVPVVTSRYIGSQAENSLIDENNCLLFETGDFAQAAAQIRRLDDEDLRNTIIRGGLDLVKNKYSEACSVEAWESAINKICKKQAGDYVTPHISIPSGRLDKMFGVKLAEVIRKMAAVEYEHKAPGDEWPHTYSNKSVCDKEFWGLARDLDK